MNFTDSENIRSGDRKPNRVLVLRVPGEDPKRFLVVASSRRGKKLITKDQQGKIHKFVN